MIKARGSGSKVYLYEKGQAGETPHSAEFLLVFTEKVNFLFYFVRRIEFNAYLKQIKVILSAVKNIIFFH